MDSKINALLNSGKVKKVGVSNHNLEQVKYVDTVLKRAGYQLHAIQNHYSLLYTTVEESGLLDYCKENDIAVFTYMVLEQGALSRKYTVDNPLPEDTRRGDAFPKETLAKLKPLFQYMNELAQKYNVSTAQIPVAHAIAKWTISIVGVTKVEQVTQACQAIQVVLQTDEVKTLERIAKETGDTC